MKKETKQKIINLLQDVDDFYWCNGIPHYDTEKELSVRIGEMLKEIGGYEPLIDERMTILKEVK